MPTAASSPSVPSTSGSRSASPGVSTGTLRLVRCDFDEAPPLDSFADRTLFQTRAWLDFVAEATGAEPVMATVLDGDERPVGRFTGMIQRAYGLKLLGSPSPRWTTLYMGFNLAPEVRRREALRALEPFAFRALKCVHYEVMDRHALASDHAGPRTRVSPFPAFEVDLTRDEDALFGAMTSACRRCIRKAGKNGVYIEIADPDGFVDDYAPQLRDVFAKQQLSPPYGPARVEALIRHLHPVGRLLLLRARDPEGTPIATGVFPAMNDTMYFWGGASWRSHQRLRPNEALMWFAMRYWKERGVARFDMGGGGPYKRKYGGRKIAVPWARTSRVPAVGTMREMARRTLRAQRRLAGALAR